MIGILKESEGGTGVADLARDIVALKDVLGREW